jgi:hypothetical protein
MKSVIFLVLYIMVVGVSIIYATDNNKLSIVRTKETLEINLTNYVWVGGIQFSILTSPNIVFSSLEQGARINPQQGWIMGYSKLNNSINILVLNMELDSLSPGEGVLVKIPFQLKNTYEGGQVRLERVMLITPSADSLGVSISNLEWSGEPSIENNFPNPFNSSTVIKFTVPEKEMVKLIVYNILGQEVKTLINEEKEQGKYEAPFYYPNLSSGVYLYRFQAGNYIETRKMLFLK